MHRSKITAVSALAASLLAAPSFAQDTYLIGVTAAVTGPLASGFVPVVDGMRIYVDKVNAAGGINGKKLQLLIRDDQSEATKGAANAKRLLSQDNVNLLINASSSTTYQPMIAEAKRAGTPTLFVGVCPTEVYPPAQPLFFCTNSFASQYDSRAALDFIKEAAGSTNLNLGLLSLALPVARAEIDFAEVRSKQMGMRPVDKELLPPATADFTPFATKLSAAKPDWIWSWTAWDLQVATLEATRRLGWVGKFLGWSHIQAEDTLAGVKDRQFYTIGTNSYFFTGLPVQKEITETAKAAGISYAASRLAEGWIAGMTIEAIFKATGKDVTPAKIASAMESLKVDTKGLRGEPIEWSKDNHFRKRQSYRVHRWNGANLESVGSWRHYDVK
jgi:ABC-type branched-subunit amino acid transport system substrate-binding protein